MRKSIFAITLIMFFISSNLFAQLGMSEWEVNKVYSKYIVKDSVDGNVRYIKTLFPLNEGDKVSIVFCISGGHCEMIMIYPSSPSHFKLIKKIKKECKKNQAVNIDDYDKRWGYASFLRTPVYFKPILPLAEKF